MAKSVGKQMENEFREAVREATRNELELDVIYRGLNTETVHVSVTRQARGRSGQVRPIELAVPFHDSETLRQFQEALDNGALTKGQTFRISLRLNDRRHPKILAFVIPKEDRVAQ